MRQIIAIGGGGFGREIKDLKIEKYIVSQSSNKKPSICFIPTATGDDESDINNYYKAFDSLDCSTSHINLFKRTIDLEKHINTQDIIFVGGGNTKSMLAVWKEWGLHYILQKAYNNGVIMSGVSAGAICWFEHGITDSWAEHQEILPCLGFVKGTCCPHYDEEPERIPYVRKMLASNELEHCYAIEGFSALHLIDDQPKYTVNFGVQNQCHDVSYNGSEVAHTVVLNTKIIDL